MAKKKAAPKKSAKKVVGNWVADMNVHFTRGAKNEDVKDRQKFVVTASDEASARKAATAAYNDVNTAKDNLKLVIQVRPLTEKENVKWEAEKHVPVF